MVKLKPKQPKLKFIKEDPNDLLVWSTELKSLYEQRRIQHLVEQARMKGSNRYDWVYEAQVRARKIEWGTGKMLEDKTENEDLIKMNENSSDCGDENFSQEDECDPKLANYGICISPKGVKHDLFNDYGMQQSTTYIAM